MRRQSLSVAGHYLLLLASLGLACSAESPSDGGAAGSATGGVGVAGAATAGSSNSGSPTTSGGAAATPSAGAAGQLGGPAGSAAGGFSTSGGQQAGGAAANGGASGGNAAGSGGGGAGGGGGGCIPTKTWGTADPSSPGPFEVVVEKDVGPGAGEPDALHDNMVPHFNVYRPKDVSQGYCHPVITWGNGTNDQPEPNPPGCPSGSCGHYKTLLNQLASHGFVVVASLSSQTAKGTPLPQVVGVDWMIAENANPASALYHRLDIAHIGATGHSQGGAATTMSGADPRIVAIAPICGSRANITLHGPALLLCGGADTTVPCSSVQTAYDSISTVPVMLGELAGVTHGSWIGSIKDPVMVGVTGWMRVHLMNDTANRSMFYGASCKTCSDSKWKIQRKMMDQ